MKAKRALLKHYLAGLVYRTAKATRNAPPGFASLRIAPKTRTPLEIVRHMDSVLGYARTFFIGGSYRAPESDDFQQTLEHFYSVVEALAADLESGMEPEEVEEENLLQGPLSDAMTHAGQLAMLRRLAGRPIPPENFIVADISPDRLGPDQPPPVQPDEEWPEAPDKG